MCKLDNQVADEVKGKDASSNERNLKTLVAFLAAMTIACMMSTIVLATKDQRTNIVIKETVTIVPATKAEGPNPCEGKKPKLENVQCVINGEAQTGEQSGVNVTKGYQGERETDAVPITGPYWRSGLCVVNVRSINNCNGNLQQKLISHNE
jgi:hypothetical protein